MTSEAQTANGSLTRLRRTLTLPLSRMKSRGRSYNSSETHSEADCLNGTKNDSSTDDTAGQIQPRNSVPNITKNTNRKKNHIRVSRIDHNHVMENKNSDTKDTVVSSPTSEIVKVDVNGTGENSLNKSENTGTKKEKKKTRRYRRWPTQTLARVLDTGLLKRIGSIRRNEHAASVLRTVTVQRHPGDTLGIYIKQVKGNDKTETGSAVIISRLVPGSIAEKQGLLNRGDEVLFVNNKDVKNLPLTEVAALMDYHRQLIIGVRSKHASKNNNNNNNTKNSVNTSSSEEDRGIHLVERAISQPAESETLLPTSSNGTVSREEIIPSVYDNNFSLDATELSPSTKVKHRVEEEYDEAFQILLNAINSFETPTRSTSDAPRDGLSYWTPLNDLITESPNNDDTLDNENVFLSSDSANTSTCTSVTPQFPSVSELSPVDGPDYDEVYASDIESSVGDEVQVDGFARLYSPYRRSHSVSCDSTERINHPVNLELLSLSVKKSDDSFADVHKNNLPSDVTHGVNNERTLHAGSSDSTTGHDSKTGKKSNLHGVTVGQCREWLGKDKESMENVLKRNHKSSQNISTVHGDPGPHSDYQNKASTSSTDNSGGLSPEILAGSDTPSTAPTTPLPDPKTNAESQSPIERSPKSLFKVLSTENGNTDNSLQDVTQVTGTQSVKNFWSKVASPPSLRKNKITRKITKLTKKKGGSVDWDSTDSTASSSVMDRYNLEPGEVQNHRLSCQFLTHNRQTTHDPSIKPLNMADFQKYKPPSPNSDGKYSQIPIEGSLVITIYGARYIKKTVSEVYCISQVDDNVKHRIRTRMQPCRGSVAWNECYEVKLQDAYDLHVTLYTWESEGKHKELAKSTLPVSDLLCGPQGVGVKLAVKLESRGTLYIKLSIEDPSTLQGPKVFGADIQSILNREQSGLHIPLIVRDCIQEVEQRGMSVIGIYRLCGSAIVKKELRKKYEKDSASVDISQENYPDVNVITGILKDFLRELPQPLFPPELLEAVTLKMESCAANSRLTSVSSAFEPTPIMDFPEEFTNGDSLCTGRQSVILKLIEVEKKVTLPPAEKATLYALLNHLKKVAANQAQNKMSCQNLAVCFGPVLLGSINMAPPKGMDLAAAIGFKQHIQVLNFMVSNWPNDPVPLDSAENTLMIPDRLIENSSDEDSKRASKRMSRVSLTRRISHIFPSHESSASGLSIISFESEARNSGLGRLSNSRKSGSLTNILESNLNDGEEFNEENYEYFDYMDRTFYCQQEEDDDDIDNDEHNNNIDDTHGTLNDISQVESSVSSVLS